MSRRLVFPLLTLLLFVVMWQALIALFRVPVYLIPAPTDVARSAAANWETLARHSWVTLYEIIAGFSLSILVGVPLAVAIVYSKFLEELLYPILVASQTVPKVAVAPLFVVWMGFGDLSKIVVAFLIAFFPVVIFTVVGLESAEREMLQMVRSMGASQWDVFRKVRFPHALPSVFGGLKVAITLAVIGAIVGEFVGSNAGLGYLLLVATGNIDTPLLFAAILFLTVIGVILFYTVDAVGRGLMPWYEPSRAEDLAVGTM